MAEERNCIPYREETKVYPNQGGGITIEQERLHTREDPAIVSIDLNDVDALIDLIKAARREALALAAEAARDSE